MGKTQRAKQPQGYDSSLKDLIEQQAPAILPVLLPGVVYEGTLNVDLVRSTMRGDKVYSATIYLDATVVSANRYHLCRGEK